MQCLNWWFKQPKPLAKLKAMRARIYPSKKDKKSNGSRGINGNGGEDAGMDYVSFGRISSDGLSV